MNTSRRNGRRTYSSRFLILLPLVLVSGHLRGQSTFLSNLSATYDSPLFTTYAAPLERSHYIVDQGYQFLWNDTSAGALFGSAAGGNLCLAFRLGGDVRYSLGRYAVRPVVTTSYSDLVRYGAYPFPGIRLEVTFQVYSSQLALQDLFVTNEGSSPADLSIYPFFDRGGGEVTAAQMLPEGDGMTFKHVEHPDGWTVDHAIPFQSGRIDAFVMDTVADGFGGYTALGTLGAPTSRAHHMASNYCVEWGTLTHPDGSPCTHSGSAVQQTVIHGNNLNEVLTESAPKWGDPDPNIPGNGYQGCELGHFAAPAIVAGDSFRVIIGCTAIGGRGESSGLVPSLPASSGVRLDVHCQTAPALQPPGSLLLSLSADSTQATISWGKQSGWKYHLYRRSSSTPGHFTRIAADLLQGSWNDNALIRDSVYSYIVIGEDQQGNLTPHSLEVTTAGGGFHELFQDLRQASLWNRIASPPVTLLALQRNFTLPPGGTRHLRIARGVAADSVQAAALADSCRSLFTLDLHQSIAEDEQRASRIPHLAFADPDEEMLYWDAFNLLRQVMMPPEGECTHPYYVFSREPQWGWGHGGEVFHESLSMLATVLMDTSLAMNSQRVYFERQLPDGYINYRTGPYLDEQIPYGGQLTTSAPWLSFENWDLYQFTGNHRFLGEAYAAGTKFYRFWQQNRDADGDSLCEWGGHAVLESVRDGDVAVWDQVGWPSLMEGLDLNCMLVSEANALKSMATELGLLGEAAGWGHEASARAARIDSLMWDEGTGFYYHIGRQSHSFTLSAPDDLKRQEMIGFLPLWAGIPSPGRAARLVTTLTNPAKFWRPFGIPSLSADDPYYSTQGYWNGPMWVQWNYLFFRGLLRYGYVDLARQLTHRVTAAMISALKSNHSLWEMYDPDTPWAGWNRQYIWAGIVARMLYDLSLYGSESTSSPVPRPVGFFLEQNYPNPFNPSTTIEFRLPAGQAGIGDLGLRNEALTSDPKSTIRDPKSTSGSVASSHVTLKVFDLLGREVAVLVNEVKPPGSYSVAFNASGLASGVYFYRLVAGGHSMVRRMAVVK